MIRRPPRSTLFPHPPPSRSSSSSASCARGAPPRPHADDQRPRRHHEPAAAPLAVRQELPRVGDRLRQLGEHVQARPAAPGGAVMIRLALTTAAAALALAAPATAATTTVDVGDNWFTPNSLDRKSTRLNSSHANLSYAV